MASTRVIRGINLLMTSHIMLRALLFKLIVILPVWLLVLQYAMAEQDTYMIDDRNSADKGATSGNIWRMVTDNVMGGVSSGQLTLEIMADRPCLHMQGDVRLDNNGGFVQIALDLSDAVMNAAPAYQGIRFDVLGNDEDYNLHLRTKGLWFPWQSYRATFKTTGEWQTVRIPFSKFEAYRTFSKLDTSDLTRIGFVAIGREFSANLCVTNIRLYR